MNTTSCPPTAYHRALNVLQQLKVINMPRSGCVPSLLSVYVKADVGFMLYSPVDSTIQLSVVRNARIDMMASCTTSDVSSIPPEFAILSIVHACHKGNFEQILDVLGNAVAALKSVQLSLIDAHDPIWILASLMCYVDNTFSKYAQIPDRTLFLMHTAIILRCAYLGLPLINADWINNADVAQEALNLSYQNYSKIVREKTWDVTKSAKQCDINLDDLFHRESTPYIQRYDRTDTKPAQQRHEQVKPAAQQPLRQQETTQQPAYRPARQQETTLHRDQVKPVKTSALSPVKQQETAQQHRIDPYCFDEFDFRRAPQSTPALARPDNVPPAYHPRSTQSNDFPHSYHFQPNHLDAVLYGDQSANSRDRHQESQRRECSPCVSSPPALSNETTKILGIVQAAKGTGNIHFKSIRAFANDEDFFNNVNRMHGSKLIVKSAEDLADLCLAYVVRDFHQSPLNAELCSIQLDAFIMQNVLDGDNSWHAPLRRALCQELNCINTIIKLLVAAAKERSNPFEVLSAWQMDRVIRYKDNLIK